MAPIMASLFNMTLNSSTLTQQLSQLQEAFVTEPFPVLATRLDRLKRLEKALKAHYPALPSPTTLCTASPWSSWLPNCSKTTAGMGWLRASTSTALKVTLPSNPA